MYERACAESFFVDLYAKLFARCAAALPACATQEGETVTFRSLLLRRAQRDFEEGVEGERKRKLGATIFLGQLWLTGLLTHKIIQGCVATVLDAAEAPGEQKEGGDGGGALQTDVVEVACTLLGVIGKESDAHSPAHMDAHCERLRRWHKTGLLKGRIRFKVMDVLELREKGW